MHRDGLLNSQAIGMGAHDQPIKRFIDLTATQRRQIDGHFFDAHGNRLIIDLEKGKLGSEWRAILEKYRMAAAAKWPMRMK